MAWLGFWLAVATFIFVGAWNARKAYEVKHQTLRILLEKGEKIDALLLQQLMKPESKSIMRQSYPGEGYMMLRVMGTLSLFSAPAIGGVIFLNHLDKTNAIGLAFVLLMIGAGLHFSSRYVTQPPAKLPPKD